MTDLDVKDKNESRKLLLIFSLLIISIIIGAVLLMPALSDILATHINPGIGLKSAAVIAFFVTLILMVILTISSGDGILGEIQFLLVGFIVFFIIIWLMIAWIF